MIRWLTPRSLCRPSIRARVGGLYKKTGQTSVEYVLFIVALVGVILSLRASFGERFRNTLTQAVLNPIEKSFGMTGDREGLYRFDQFLR